MAVDHLDVIYSWLKHLHWLSEPDDQKEMIDQLAAEPYWSSTKQNLGGFLPAFIANKYNIVLINDCLSLIESFCSPSWDLATLPVTYSAGRGYFHKGQWMRVSLCPRVITATLETRCPEYHGSEQIARSAFELTEGHMYTITLIVRNTRNRKWKVGVSYNTEFPKAGLATLDEELEGSGTFYVHINFITLYVQKMTKRYKYNSESNTVVKTNGAPLRVWVSGARKGMEFELDRLTVDFEGVKINANT